MIAAELLFYSYTKTWRIDLLIRAKYIVKLVYEPLVYLLAGWWAANSACIVLKGKPFKKPYMVIVRWVLIILFIVYILVIIPRIGRYCVELHRLLLAQAANKAVNFDYPKTPNYDKVVYAIAYFDFIYSFLYVIPGAAAWFAGIFIPQHNEK